MTANDIITPLRVNLADAGGNVWTDAELRSYIEEAVRAVHTEEPESRLDSKGAVRTQSTVSANDTVLVLDTDYKPALIAYVSARAYEGEQSDQRDTEAAKSYWARWDAFWQPRE